MNSDEIRSPNISALKEAELRLKNIIMMHAEGRPHLELAQHLHKLEGLIFDAKKVLVGAHLHQHGNSSNIGYIPK
jgi:hypothetical protein